MAPSRPTGSASKTAPAAGRAGEGAPGAGDRLGAVGGPGGLRGERPASRGHKERDPSSLNPAQHGSPLTLLWLAFVALSALSVAALLLSIGEWQRPIAGVLVDPFGRVDNFGWTGWSGYQKGLAYPDRVTAVEDQSLLIEPGRTLDEAARKALSPPPPTPPSFEPGAAPAAPAVPAVPAATPTPPGQPPSLRLLVEQSGSFRLVTVYAERLGLMPWLLLAGGYQLLAWLWLLAAGLCYTVRPHSRAVTSFARCVLIAAALFITTFDFHTTRALVLINLLVYAMLPTALIEFGLCFPQRLPLLLARPRLVYGLRVIDVALASLLLSGYLRHQNYRPIIDVLSAGALVLLTITLSLRCAQAQGQRRTQLLLALLLLLLVYLVLGGLVLWAPPGSAPYVYMVAIPFTVLGALGVTWALLRYDLWDSQALLHRPGLRPLLTATLSFVGGLLGVIGCILLRERSAAVQIGYVLFLILLSGPVYRRLAVWLDAALFPADAYYRHTVEELSLRFADLGSQAAVVDTVEQTVRQVLKVERVRLLPIPQPTDGLESAEFGRYLPKVARAVAAAMVNGKVGTEAEPQSEVSALLRSSGQLTSRERRGLKTLRRVTQQTGLFSVTPEQAAALGRGEPVYLMPPKPTNISMPALWSWLLIAARYRDQVVGILAVAPKSPSQLFTSVDENLLRTIANQAALALSCAHATAQLESLRKAQEEVFREQLDAAIGTIAAEIAHEIRFPINFFRMLLDNAQRAATSAGTPTAGALPAATAASLSEDLDIGREEVARLERMADHLRGIAVRRTLDRKSVALRPLVERVRMLLRDRLQSRLLELDVAPTYEVDCDADALTQVLLNLLSNGLDACPKPGRIGVTTAIEGDQRLRLTVWDAGPGLSIEAGKIFQPWVTTKSDGSGLGLAVTHRLVRAHGWDIVVARREGRTCFDVLIAGSDWRKRGAPLSDEAAEFDDTEADPPAE